MTLIGLNVCSPDEKTKEAFVLCSHGQALILYCGFPDALHLLPGLLAQKSLLYTRWSSLYVNLTILSSTVAKIIQFSPWLGLSSGLEGGCYNRISIKDAFLSTSKAHSSPFSVSVSLCNCADAIPTLSLSHISSSVLCFLSLGPFWCLLSFLHLLSLI